MCLEMEETLDATYQESQMRIVSESVTRFYSDVMKELLPLSASDSDETTTAEIRIDQDADICFCKKSSQGFKHIAAKANTKLATLPTQDSSINHDFDNDAIYAESCDTDADIKLNLNSDENQQNKMFASMTAAETTSLKTNTFSTSESCETSNTNQNDEATHSEPSSVEVTTLASVADCCNEIENASVEQISSVVEFVKSDEENMMKMVSSSNVVFGDPSGTTLASVTVCCGEIENASVVKSDEENVMEMVSSLSVIFEDPSEQGDNKTLQQDDELKFEETCVMVTKDELQLVPKETINMMTSKKKRWQPFSLSNKSTRKQEYEELATWHGNNENGKGEYVESSCPTLLEDQKKPLLPELDWELL